MESVQAALEKAEQAIKGVEQEMATLKVDKPEFWREDLVALRKEEGQLVKKEKQLREERLFIFRSQ